MDVAFKRKNGFIYFTAKSPDDITREQAQYIQEKYGSQVNDNGFYAFVKKKTKKVFEAKWCCRDDNNKLTNIPIGNC